MRTKDTTTRRVKLPRASRTVASLCLALSFTPLAALSQTPNLTGVWGHNDRSFRKPFVTDAGDVFTGDVIDGYNNEYLKPWVAELYMRDKLVEKSGRLLVNDRNSCQLMGVLGEFGNVQVQILQTASEITLLFQDNHYRTIYLNRPHSPQVEPSWFGESVGHFEGDSLVVDTIGIAAKPQTVSSFYGVPHTEALHVVERWRFLAENESPAPPLARDRLFSFRFNPNQIVAGSRTLRLTLTVTDPGAYRKPWTATLDYQRLRDSYLPEALCNENNRGDVGLFTPTAQVPDF
jgi:hypothetical protein